jgi:hypothetical protein
MTTRHVSVPAVLTALLLLGGCRAPLVSVNLNVVGEQTALEKQVLGTYRELGENLMIYSSVRGVNPDGSLKTPPPATDSQRAAFEAMRSREFNRDDVEQILAAGIAGEGRDGLLRLQPEPAFQTVPTLTPDQILAVIEEENRDRRAILARLVGTTPGLTPEQELDVALIFAGLNQETAPSGAWIQDASGTWRQK